MEDSVFTIRKKIRAIAEIRYPAIPSFFDNRGKIIDSIHPKIKTPFIHWRTHPTEITFVDDLEKPNTEFIVSFNRSAIVLEDFKYMKEFTVQTNQCVRLLKEEFGHSLDTLTRVGVRFLEICEVPGATKIDQVVSLVSSKLTTIPSDLMGGINATDLHLKIMHEHGQFLIGPCRVGEPWVVQSFVHSEDSIPEFGIGLDIDSYTTDLSIKNVDDIIKSITVVYSLTKATEESILKHLGLLNE